MSVRPLESGALRDFVTSRAAFMRFRPLAVLRWRPRGLNTLNASVVGVGPLRVLLLSDALLEGPRDELLAAIAHETGHVRRWHVEKLAALVLAAWIPALWLPIWAWAPAFLAFVWGIVLGPVSRRFEREADRFAADHTGASSLIALLGRIRFRVGVDWGRRHGSTSGRIAALTRIRTDRSEP